MDHPSSALTSGTSGTPPRIIYASPRRGLRRVEAALYVGVSPRTFDQWVANDSLPKPARIGGVVLWDIRQLDLAIDSLFSHDETSNPWDE